MSESPSVKFPTTAPTGSGTTVLFDSTLYGVGNFLRLSNANRFETTFQNNQTGTLNASWSADRGVTWNAYNSTAVSIPAAGASSGPYDYLIDAYTDWKLEFVNGGSDQTTWRGTCTLICGDRASGV